ncbi:polyamine-transporting ATPase 13A3-like isoform X2 [Pectinophora gossypiella]|uniref:polyamine-transporting ATPase 13A3-like isoform X2 n=1 Tax=Pectinophora gossypiella TaxID=13191 RepID=UPI00214E3F03|nr:polyamine-transporting ATPase 13A3-like isoform X2 [Pectinophora gossypiella]XP_049881694.1 polyamine-transporting ATPase 13A3-like isoform X2 [Pectinophora gossypiella]
MTLSVEQHINIDDSEMVVYGYRKSRWRTVLVYIFSVLTCGIPFLLFHWSPTWFLYVTCERCCFQLADQVLVVETYQRKCKSYYIHKILDKNVSDSSGLLNEGFQDEYEKEKGPIDCAEDLHTPIHLDDGSTLLVQHYRYFRHKKQTLVWDVARAQWFLLAGIERGASCAQLQALGAKAPSSERRLRMLNIYGLNEIKVPVQSIVTLILLEVFNPFYVFQLFTIAVWLAEPYYYYCIAVVLMSTFGVATSVIQTKKNQESLRATVEAHDTVELLDGRSVDTRHVSPGDVVVLPARGCVLHFDAALLTGSAILNESMLTGESVPVTKTALLRIDKRFDLKEHASSVLFCGTRVIQTRYYNNEPVKALVLRTGYNTSKGQLVRSILYPVPADFKFDRDSYKFIIILACIAMIGLGYTVALKAYRHLTPGDIALKALDIITIVIPPALPAAMTVGRLYCVSRLRAARVTCLNTRAVNVSGSIDCFCFDKTGTLTEDGLDMWGVVPVSPATAPPRLGRAVRDAAALNDLHDLKLGMASCHSLTLLDGELAGDPLDLKMFESTAWTLEEPDVPESTNYEILTPTIVKPKKTANINVDDIHMPLELGIVQQHQFVSSLQRSSVVVRMLGEDILRVYCKGAPEMLRTLCRPETVPDNLNEVLSSYAEKGYRVIAMSTRVMETTMKQLQRMTREEVERDLEFLGLVIMENRLKAATTDIIRELKEANIHVVMITGDNVHTAVSVAKECGILAGGERVVHLNVDTSGPQPELYCESTLHGAPIGRRTPLQRSWRSVDSGRGSWRGSGSASTQLDVETGGEASYKVVMTGHAWQVLLEHYPSMVPRVVARGAVFARMSSDQKQRLVVEYQALGYYVGMCGDGANDCGALRAAHTGISLSELESSVAAPFTSQHPDIVCVTRVLREGRAALTTSFGVFKFMIAYSLTEFLSVAFLYYFDSNLTDFQFLYIDVALIVNFAFFFGMTEAYTGKLCKIPPLTSLLGFVPLLSLIGQMVLIVVAQFLSYYALTFYPWYERHLYEGDEANECWENYAIFAVSMFQYVIQAIVFSHGAPYRKSVITNKQLMISMLIMIGICIYIVLSPAEWLARFLELRMPLDISMGYIVLALASFNFVLALFFERVIIQYMMERKEIIPRCLKEKKVRKTPYLTIKRQLTDMDYLDCDSVVKFDKETSVVSDSSSGRFS